MFEIVRRRLPRPAIVVAGGVLVAIAVGAIAIGAIPDSNGVFTGCVTPSGPKGTTANLRVIDTEATPHQNCRAGETRITWSQTGPPGPPGPAGPGATGFRVQGIDRTQIPGPGGFLVSATPAAGIYSVVAGLTFATHTGSHTITCTLNSGGIAIDTASVIVASGSAQTLSPTSRLALSAPFDANGTTDDVYVLCTAAGNEASDTVSGVEIAGFSIDSIPLGP